jgi:hypothetical protein
LKYVGIDGNTYDAGEDIVQISENNGDMSSIWISEVTPQPATNYINFMLELAGDRNVTVDLFEVTGRNIGVPVFDKPFKAGFNEIKINFDETMASGTYILQVSAGGEVITKKFVVHK